MIFFAGPHNVFKRQGIRFVEMLQKEYSGAWKYGVRNVDKRLECRDQKKDIPVILFLKISERSRHPVPAPARNAALIRSNGRFPAENILVVEPTDDIPCLRKPLLWGESRDDRDFNVKVGILSYVFSVRQPDIVHIPAFSRLYPLLLDFIDSIKFHMGQFPSCQIPFSKK
jgi:hypothetical protein